MKNRITDLEKRVAALEGKKQERQSAEIDRTKLAKTTNQDDAMFEEAGAPDKDGEVSIGWLLTHSWADYRAAMERHSPASR
ncbi:hypothetical protein FACS1894208_10570 [Clostridia bacterium]|nr:hypothetical protein FACS1894208_10570 [Clostridia bacterium]